jgi:hypothetical protein
MGTRLLTSVALQVPQWISGLLFEMGVVAAKKESCRMERKETIRGNKEDLPIRLQIWICE